MRELIDKLKDLKLAILDLDGVVYRGQILIPGADRFIQDLKDLGIKVVYNSNNSTLSRDSYVRRLEFLGIPVEYDDFYTSASITAAEITKIKKNANIYVVGEEGLREELTAKGHTIIRKPLDYKEIDFVIAGLDTKFNYNKISTAQKCIIEGGARFYATNPDATLPMPQGLMPGAGVMVNSIETCTDTPPIKIFGKPSPDGIKLILSDLNITPEYACIFGDRLNTDVAAGNNAGIITVCVLTGVATREIIEKAEGAEIPDIVVNTLSEVFVN